MPVERQFEVLSEIAEQITNEDDKRLALSSTFQSIVHRAKSLPSSG